MAADRDALCGYQPELAYRRPPRHRADAITGTTPRESDEQTSQGRRNLISAQVTLTTANFPDVMLPAYERNRWPATLFFGSFLALGMFFMMNLLLATVYNTYSEERAADALQGTVGASSTLRTPSHC